nr:hypothetical protein [Maritimibacter sp. 55A14]
MTREEHEDARQVARDIARAGQYDLSMKLRKKVEMLFAHLKRILDLLPFVRFAMTLTTYPILTIGERRSSASGPWQGPSRWPRILHGQMAKIVTATAAVVEKAHVGLERPVSKNAFERAGRLSSANGRACAIL